MPRPSVLKTLMTAVLIQVSLAAIPAWADPGFSQAQKDQVDKLIHDYIVGHPDLVMSALQDAQNKADAARQAQAQSALSQHRQALLHDPNSPVLGNPQGDVTLVEFFDYRCPYCKSSAPDVTELIRSDPHLRVVMKEFPVLGPESVYASRIALIAARHGRYAAFHDAVLAYKGSLDNDTTLAIAGTVGLDARQTEKEAGDPTLDTILQANLDLAKTLSIDGTPTFIVGDTIIPGVADLDDLKEAIATARGKS
jgi:protein-disulfide isomerase